MLKQRGYFFINLVCTDVGRRRRTTIPGFEIRWLREYVTADGKPHRGIPWKFREIYDFFKPLSRATATAIISVYSRYFPPISSSSQAPKPSSTTSATPPSSNASLDRWYKHDLPALRASQRDKSIQSWYTQLSTVANSILLQCILMHAGFPTPGGTRREYNVIHVRQLLQRIPTEQPTGGHVPFVISDRSIDQWVVHMNRSEDGMDSPRSSVSMAGQ